MQMQSYVALLGVLLLAVGAWWALREPGPNRWLVLATRYGAGPLVVVAVAVALLAVVAAGREHFVSVAVLGLSWLVLVACVGGWLRAAGLVRLVRRAVLRARWPSVARSAGLGVVRDRRSRSWPGGDVVTIGSERVEYLPIIFLGRGLPGGRGVRYRLRPARGGTVDDVAQVAERLAAGLRVHRVEVERLAAHRGRLTVIYADPFRRPIPGELEQVAR